MTTLMNCPICGKQPILSSLEPDTQSMKYFCTVHIGEGDWENTKELAAESWNIRVLNHKHWSEQVQIPGTPEHLYAQASISSKAYCESCDYATEAMSLKDLLYTISMEGGYIYSDKEGGYFSQCPKCESENLTLEYY